MTLKIFDISRPIAKGEPIYPGNAPVKLTHLKTFKKDKSVLSEIALGLHTASHVDAPMHYVKNGKAVDKIDLEECIGWARVIDATKYTEIGEREVSRISPKRGEIILFKTKNSRSLKKFDKHFAHLGESGARVLVKAGVKAVGIDGPSIRKFRLRPDTVHPLLLKAGLVVYEGLQFRDIKPGRYYFMGFPLKIARGEGSPVRAVLVRG